VLFRSAQGEVFRGFAPILAGRMVGSFARGTDYVLETGLAEVHRGETITPDPQGPFGRQADQGPPQVTVVIDGDAGPLIKNVRAYVDGRVAKVNEDQGRRVRQLSAVRGR